MEKQPSMLPVHPGQKDKQRKPLSLLPGPAIAGYLIQRNDEQQAIVINGLLVLCTPDEYHLLLKLIERYERLILFDELIAQFQDASLTDPVLLKTARRKLTRTISELRTKLWPTDFAIVRVVDAGYLLIHQDKLWSLTHDDLDDPGEH